MMIDQLREFERRAEATFASKDTVRRLGDKIDEHDAKLNDTAIDITALKVELRNIGAILAKINSHMEWGVRLILAAIIGLILKEVLGL